MRSPTSSRSGLWQALADAGYLGILVPEEHGGAGLGLKEMAVLMEGMGSEGMALLLMIVSTVMATIAIARHGSEEQKRRYLPGARAGHDAVLLRDHGAERRLEQLPPGDARHARRRRLPDPRPEVLHLRRRAGAARAARDAHHAAPRGGRQAERALALHRRHGRAWLHEAGAGHRETERQWTLFLDDVRVPRAALIGEEGLGHRFTREYEVITYWPLLRLIKTAPVSREMILNYVAEHVLGLPRSY